MPDAWSFTRTRSRSSFVPRGVNPKNPIYLLKPILEVDGVIIGLNSFLQKGALESTFLNIPDRK